MLTFIVFYNRVTFYRVLIQELLRYAFFAVSENRTFELHSPDGVHSCILRAADTNDAASWFNSLHSALYVLTMKALQEANKVLSPTLIGGELHHIGWLSTRKQRLNFSVEVINFDPLPAGNNCSFYWSLRRIPATCYHLIN